MRQLTLEPLAAVCTWRLEGGQPAAAWAALLAQFLEQLARACAGTPGESGPPLIGHIKALATLPAGGYIRGSVLDTKHAPGVQTGGAFPETLTELSFTLNVLVYGLSYDDASALVEREAGRLAAELGVSPQHLSSSFKERVGVNFIEYITRRRMRLARRLLAETGATAVEVARHCGYADPTYFRKLFARYYGVSPQEYRSR